MLESVVRIGMNKQRKKPDSPIEPSNRGTIFIAASYV